MARGAIARLIAANLCRNTPNPKDVIIEQPTPKLFKMADEAMLWLSMPMTRQLEVDGQLTSLAITWERGICYTAGRIPEVAATKILTAKMIPVLHKDSKLAKMIMIQAHREDHRRMPQDALFRSRKHAWIHRGRSLAKQVVDDCGYCRVMSRILCKQRMGKLPKEMFEVPVRPFTNITLDFMGSYLVRNMTYNKRFDKIYPLVIICMNTCHIEVCGGYSTQDFITAFEGYMAWRGEPNFCYSDSGSQLKAAKREISDGREAEKADMNEDERPNIKWSEVQAKTAGAGITWKIAPPGSQNRDGRTERAIACLKKTMKHLYVSRDLNLLEFDTLLRKAANCLNDRPLSVYDVNDGEPGLAPLTPNLMLQNFRAPSALEALDKYEECTDKLVVRNKYCQAQFESWWSHWYRAVFQNLIPYRRWKQEAKNLKVDDVCLLMYKGRIPPAVYRMCRVVEVFPDDEGLVRTVRVALVSRDQRMRILPHNTGSLVYMKVAVQRLVLIYSKDEEEERRKENVVVKVNSVNVKEWPLLA